MPTAGHIVVGLAAARGLAPRAPLRRRETLALVALAALPDLDILGLPFRPALFRTPFAHRGATHSLAFVLAVAAAAVAVGLVGEPGRRRRALLLAALAAASHPILDAFTLGSQGVMLLWPLTTARFHAPFLLFDTTPVGGGATAWQVARFAGRELLVFGPLAAWAMWPRPAAASTSAAATAEAATSTAPSS